MGRRLLIVAGLLGLAVALFAFPSVQTVAAGVAIFLIGMRGLEDGFAGFGGGALERVLHRATASRGRALGFGIATTALMQSSSLVTVITISFLSAGLMTLGSGIVVILGANLGTTTGAWLMAAFGMKANLSAASMPMLVFGVLFAMQRRPALRAIGSILAGVGFLFLGIHFMKAGFETLSATIDLTAWAVPGVLGLLVYTLLGAAMTVVMQSSHATLMLTIAALSEGQVTYENALALAIGANIGTTISAILGAAGSNARGRRLAAAHVVFNVATGVVALVAIVPLGALVDVTGSWLGVQASNWTMKLAIFHTLFNLLGVALLWPWIGALERRLNGWFVDAHAPSRTVWLNEATARHPGAAVEAMGREAMHLLDNAFEVLVHAMGLRREDVLSSRPLVDVVAAAEAPFDEDVLARYHDRVKQVFSELFAFASDATPSFSRPQRDRADGIRVACRRIVAAVRESSLMVPNLLRLGRGGSPETVELYQLLRMGVARAFREVYHVRAADALEDRANRLAALRAAAEQVDRSVTARVDELVRANAIPPHIATSVINDGGHTYEIMIALADAAERLFVVHEPDGAAFLEQARERAMGTEPRTSIRDAVADLARSRGASPGHIGGLTGEYERIRRDEDERARVRRGHPSD